MYISLSLYIYIYIHTVIYNTCVDVDIHILPRAEHRLRDFTCKGVATHHRRPIPYFAPCSPKYPAHRLDILCVSLMRS